MNVYITKLNGMPLMSAEQYAQQMAANIAHSLGVREMGIHRYYADDESEENLKRRLDGIIAGISAGDIVICQFPTWNGLEFERELLWHIKAYHGRIVIFIHDLEAVMSENRRSMLQDTLRIYNEAELLIVPSYGMKQFLINQGIRAGMKFIVQEAWDYTTMLRSMRPGKLKREIHFAENPDRFYFLRTWSYDVLLKVYVEQEVRGGDYVQSMGWLPSERLLLELSEGGFGLVWYGNECGHQYLTMNGGMNLSVYLAAGIPVIVPRGISNQCLIEENHLGIVVDTLDEATEIVKSITEQEYQEYTSAVAKFSDLLKDGYFTKKCLVDTLQMLMRKDMYIYSESNETYEMQKGIFEYVCLKESYENDLALSWIFRGEAEGFLIYDADSGKQVGEVYNGLEHYLLLKNYSKEARFIVKAYIRTVKGKLILAESDMAKIAENYLIESKVSLVIPAYNAEKFIARGIDTALAQDFRGLEILIVNDGSTDQTQKILDWYKGKYPQVRSFYQSNSGQAVARNLGVKYAEGDYIGFMDSDDMLRPDMIGKLYDSIIRNECDITMSSAYQMTNEGYEVVGAYSLKENAAIPVEDFFELYIQYAYPVIWNKLYRKTLVEEHPIPAVTYEDSAWTPYILSYADQICYVDEPLYGYDRMVRNVTYIHTSMGKTAEEQFKDRRDYVMFFLKNGNPQKWCLLKKLALGYAVGFVNAFSFPGFRELRKEIEDMVWVDEVKNQRKDSMNILITTNTDYIEIASVMVYSLCQSHKNVKIDIYLAYHDLREVDIDRLQKIVSFFEKNLYPVDVGDEFVSKISAKGRFSQEIYYRILALKMLPQNMERILYLDVDMLIKKSLTEVYKISMDDTCPFIVCDDIAGRKRGSYELTRSRVSIPDSYKYFNTGFMLMNLNYLRQGNNIDNILDLFCRDGNRYPYPDQDILNRMYYSKVQYVPWILYNLPPEWWKIDIEEISKGKIRFATYMDMNNPSIEQEKRFADATLQIRDNAYIIHYLWILKPWLYRNKPIYPDVALYAGLWFDCEQEMYNTIEGLEKL